MSRYRVLGPRRYREHDPGTEFEATLDLAAERRAIARGSIEVVDSSPTRLRPGSAKMPRKRPGKKK